MDLTPHRLDIPVTEPARELDLRAIIAVLRRQLRMILLSAVGVLLLAALYLLLVPETYTASVLVQADPRPRSLLEQGPAAPSSSGSENARVDSEVEILRSDAIALAVIEKEGLLNDPEFAPGPGRIARLAALFGLSRPAARPDPETLRTRTLSRLRKAISVRRKGLTYLISITASSRDPKKAARIANAIASAYIAQQVDAKVAAALSARDVLQGQIDAARATLSQAEARLDAYIDEQLGKLELTASSETLRDLRQRLARTRARLRAEQTSRAALAARIRGHDWASLGDIAADDPSIRDLRARRERLASRLANGNDSAAGSGDSADAFQAQLAEIDKALERRSGAGLARIDSRIEQIKAEEQRLRAQLREAILQGDIPPEMLSGIYALQQESAIARTQYQDLLTRLRKLETEARIQVADSRVVSAAIVPVTPSAPNRTLVLMAALAAALGLGVSLAFLREYYIGGVTSPTQLAELTQAPTAATLPLSDEQNSGRMSVADRIIDTPLSVYSESVRKLRAAIDQGLRGHRQGHPSPALPASGTSRGGGGARGAGKVILVTSALPDEGKTTTALALARTYALSGSRTLLMDADLRKPSLHRHLGYEPQSGFLDYLRDSEARDLEGSFYARDPASPLALIMGAARAELPTDQLLGSARFASLLKQAREVYDIVIIDSPPVLPVVDARYIAPRADAVVLVVKWAGTGQGDLRAALQPLSEAMRPDAPLHPVLNLAPEGRSADEYTAYASGYGEPA